MPTAFCSEDLGEPNTENAGNRPICTLSVHWVVRKLGYEQRGLSGPPLQQETGRVLGTFATVESVAFGFRLGLRVLSLTMLALGLIVALLLWQAAKGLRAPPGAGYT